jgi:hypothetical protein
MRAAGIGLICAVLFLTNGASVLAQSEATNEIPKPIEQCIRDNAPAVEKAISRLPDAVAFLVSDLCAKPIADEQTRLQRERWAPIQERLRKQCAQRKTKPTPGLDTNGEEDPCFDMGDVFDFTAGGGSQKLPAATALAAKILLDLRIARMNATSTQGTH